MRRMLRIVRIALRSAWGFAAARTDPEHPPHPEQPYPSRRQQGSSAPDPNGERRLQGRDLKKIR